MRLSRLTYNHHVHISECKVDPKIGSGRILVGAKIGPAPRDKTKKV
jgi:hypothetical protein